MRLHNASWLKWTSCERFSGFHKIRTKKRVKRLTESFRSAGRGTGKWRLSSGRRQKSRKQGRQKRRRNEMRRRGNAASKRLRKTRRSRRSRGRRYQSTQPKLLGTMYALFFWPVLLLPLLSCDEKQSKKHKQATYSSVTYWRDRLLCLPCATHQLVVSTNDRIILMPHHAFTIINDLHVCNLARLLLCRSICRSSSKESKKGCSPKLRRKRQQKGLGPSGTPLPPSATSLEAPLLLAMLPLNLKMTFPPRRP